jgi:type IV pilus assembly protein PilM
MRWLRKNYEPIGIDVGASGARMVQLRIEGDAPVVVAAARCTWDEALCAQFETGTTPSPTLIGERLRRMAAQGQFRGREAVIGLPREIVQIKNFRLPAMPEDELILAAEQEAKALFQTHEEQSQIRVLPAGEVRQGNETRREIIAACVRRNATDALVEQWHDVGFRPVGFDLDVIALYRGIEKFVRRRDDESEVNVILEIGHRRTLVMIGRGRELNFCKAIDIGGAMLSNAIARKLGITMSDATTLRNRLSETIDQSGAIGNDPVRQAVIDTIRPIVEDLSREAALCLRYFSVNFRGQRPSRVRVVGTEAIDRTIISLLGKSMPVPVEAGRTIANADLSRMKSADRTDGIGDWSMAFGLALKFTAGGFADRLGTPRAATRLNLTPGVSDSPNLVVPPVDVEIETRAVKNGEAVDA